MSSEDLTRCEGCQRLTRTVFGKCPNCLYVKDPEKVLPQREYKPSGSGPHLWGVDGGLFGVSDLFNAVGETISGLFSSWW